MAGKPIKCPDLQEKFDKALAIMLAVKPLNGKGIQETILKEAEKFGLTAPEIKELESSNVGNYIYRAKCQGKIKNMGKSVGYVLSDGVPEVAEAAKKAPKPPTSLEPAIHSVFADGVVAKPVSPEVAFRAKADRVAGEIILRRAKAIPTVDSGPATINVKPPPDVAEKVDLEKEKRENEYTRNKRLFLREQGRNSPSLLSVATLSHQIGWTPSEAEMTSYIEGFQSRKS